MQFYRNLMKLPFALLAMLCMPAFASKHKQADYSIGILRGLVEYWACEFTHLWGHIQALALAASTGNWEFFKAANLCADQAFLTSVFFTWYGLLSISATSILVGVLYKRRRAYQRLALAG